MSGASRAEPAAVPAAEAFALSHQQRRIWSLAGTGGEPFVGCVVRVEGDLVPARLERAVAAAVRRHEILRTRFVRRTGLKVPFQRVDPDGSADLAPAGGAGGGERLDVECFDVENGPVLRVGRSDGGEGVTHLAFTLSALCGDPASLDLLVAEVLAEHEGEAAAPDADDPLQYADYAAWQEELLETEDEDLRRAAEHWRRASPGGGAPAAGGGTFAPVAREVALDGATAAAARRLAARLEVPVATVVLAGWAALLGRLSGSGEVTVGGTTDGRSFEDLSGGLGPFARVAPLRLPVDESAPFVDLLAAVAREERAAREWQDYAGLLAGEDGLREPPLLRRFRAEREAPSHRIGGLGYRVVERSVRSEPCELELVAVVGEEDLRIVLHHDPSTVSGEEAERWAGRLADLLAGAVAAPERRLGSLESLAPAERRLLLEAFDRSAGEPGEPELFPHRFRRWVREAPDRPALETEGRTITYGELGRRVDGLARRLRALGVGPEARVALLLPREPEMVVAILATSMAGGAWVPIDPAFPADRVRRMLEDARVTASVSVSTLAGSLPGAGAQVVLLDRGREALAEHAGTPPADGGAGPRHLMYTIFTSGSTGRPKGVAVEHRQAAAYLDGLADRLGLARWGGGARFTFLSTFAADLGHTALLSAFAFGGCLVLVPAEHALDSAALAETFRRRPADLLKIVPSHLAALLQAAEGAAVLPSRCLVLGGEAASPEILRRVAEAAPGLEVFNHYGPTETTVGVLAGALPPGAPGGPDLGRPLAGVRVRAVNPWGVPVPAGVDGELVVGGRSVSRGYLGRPAETAARFLPDPFASEPGARLYATGDLVRFGSAGELRFVGRADGQVKLRGHRTELGEIEAVLAAHPEVWEAAVALRPAPGVGERLVAYVVPRRGADPEPEALRLYLGEHLPEHMVPTAVVELDALPLSPTGKVDRGALPAPEAADERRDVAVSVPGSLLELELVRMWEELLGVRPLGVDENFFTLGGHSLLAVRLMARIERRIGRSLPLATLYRAPTVKEMAEVLEADGAGPEPSPLVAIQPAASEGADRPPLFCVHPMGGEVLCYYHLSRALGEDQPVYGLQARGLGLEHGGEPSLEEMAACYVAAVTEALPDGPYLLSGYSFGSKVAFEMARQLIAQGREVALLALLDGGAPGKKAQLDTVDEAVLVAQAFREEARQKGREFPLRLETVRAVEAERRLDFVVAEAKEHGYLAPEVTVETVREYARGVRDRQRASESYRPDPYPGSVVYFRSTEHDEEFVAILEEAGYDDMDSPVKGWERFVAGPIRIHDVPGVHETLLLPPSVEVLAAGLRTSIDAAVAELRNVSARAV